MKNAKISKFSKFVVGFLIVASICYLFFSYFRPEGYILITENSTPEQIAKANWKTFVEKMMLLSKILIEALLFLILIVNMFKALSLESKYVSAKKIENNEEELEKIDNKRKACFNLIIFVPLYYLVFVTLLFIINIIKPV